MKRLLPILSLIPALGSAGACSSPTGPNDVTVSGRVVWFDTDSVPHPAAGVKIAVRLDGGYVFTDTLLATVLTDANGLFTMQLARYSDSTCSLYTLEAPDAHEYVLLPYQKPLCGDLTSLEVELMPLCLWSATSWPCPTTPPPPDARP
jgi:hypothetical protein